VTALAAGCVWSGDLGPPVSVGVENGTDRTVRVFLDERLLAEVPQRSDVTDVPNQAPGILGPWRLEVRTETGVVLAAAEVADDPPAGTGVGTASATTCGDVVVWIGDTRPDLVVPDVTGGRIDCDG
jgi:hypothetical protein